MVSNLNRTDRFIEADLRSRHTETIVSIKDLIEIVYNKASLILICRLLGLVQLESDQDKI